MSLPLIRNIRLPVLALALGVTGAGFGAAITPAPAAAQDGPYYVATLAETATDTRPVAAGVAWVCKGTTCVANKGPSRPLRICRGLAREFGEITSFTAKGKVLADDELAKCNGN
ncbi:hypothetical protein [Erythrobacter sp. MTPC3]|uniref:CC_3452 family protein n=1 Tax=Erythrobacter sp. MTPC3 TaxID=3056564 RepID=UPI0036F3E974